MPMDHLDELDRLLGPVAVMDLEQRGLLPRPGVTGTSSVAEGIDRRIAGALLGMAIGAGMARDGRRPAQVQLAVEWGRTLLKDGRSAGPAFSGRLSSLAAGLRVPGEATARTVRRLGEGAPWHAAAPDSK